MVATAVAVAVVVCRRRRHRRHRRLLLLLLVPFKALRQPFHHTTSEMKLIK